MSHLTEQQRYTISAMLSQNFSQTTIAATIGKDKSVVSRELRRNRDMRSGEYRCGLAQRKYEERLRQKSKAVKFKAEVRERVEAMLAEDLSPEQIAGRCRLKGLDCVSHERIYQHVWADKRRGGDLYTHLRRRGRKYRKRGANENMNGLIRQYIPKKTSFEDLNDEDIQLIQNKLNNRPRKRLNFLTPIEYFCRNFEQLTENINKKVAFIT